VRLYERVVPFYEALGASHRGVSRATPRFCGRGGPATPTSCSSRWRASRIGPPALSAARTNGFVERMNRTAAGRVLPGRRPHDLVSSEPQRFNVTSNRFLEHYNLQGSHQGYRLGGRTPAQALQESLGVAELPPLVPAEGEEMTHTRVVSQSGW